MQEISIRLKEQLAKELNLGRRNCEVTLDKDGDSVVCTDHTQRTESGCRTDRGGCPLRDTVLGHPLSLKGLKQLGSIIE